MIIFKCFLCDFESNNKNILKKKQIGQTYECPECKMSNGCLVETETQQEFSPDYLMIVKRNKVMPVYYGKTISKPDNNDIQQVALQIFEFIDIAHGVFIYGYCNVPGLFYSIDRQKTLFLAKECAVIQPVGKNVLISKEERNPKSEMISYETKSIDEMFIDSNKEILPENINNITKLKKQNFKLINDLYGLNLYKIFEFDLEYLINSPINFKKSYTLPSSLAKGLRRKYETTQNITYANLSQLNNLWHTYDIFYMGIPSLHNIELWLNKAWNSKAVCCGVVPFAPLADWYINYITKKANAKLIKQQKGIPFPLVEFSYRHTPKKKKNSTLKHNQLLTKEDKKLGQSMFNFTKDDA